MVFEKTKKTEVELNNVDIARRLMHIEFFKNHISRCMYFKAIIFEH